jgi:pimeloyl-ACP methyl ester carboxylesterase
LKDSPLVRLPATRLIGANAVDLEVADWGAGEPLVFIQTALTADELVPIATRPELERFRKVLYYRRGYGASSAVEGPGSIARDASDCIALMDALRIRQAHLVGLSYSGAVALQVASHSPERVHTLTVIEPPPTHAPSGPEFRETCLQLIRDWEERGDAALTDFLYTILGPDFVAKADELAPGAGEQMRRDATTFFDTDIPALLTWQFGRDDARRIGCPVLYVGGGESSNWFQEVHTLLMAWLPAAEDAVVQGAGHGLALTHAPLVAAALAAFLSRHPM